MNPSFTNLLLAIQFPPGLAQILVSVADALLRFTLKGLGRCHAGRDLVMLACR